MARAYSLDLRERVVGAVAAGQSCRFSVAKTFMVSVASVVKWSQRRRVVGSPAALKMGGRKALPCGAREGLGSDADRREAGSHAAGSAWELADRGLVVVVPDCGGASLSLIRQGRRMPPMASRSSRERPHDAACSSRAPSVEESARSLAARYGLNAKTVRKWRGRTTTTDEPMGPKTPKSTVPVTYGRGSQSWLRFGRRLLLPLDDVLGCLKDAIPNLSRSALHRCLQRHGVSRLPVEETQERRKEVQDLRDRLRPHRQL